LGGDLEAVHTLQQLRFPNDVQLEQRMTEISHGRASGEMQPTGSKLPKTDIQISLQIEQSYPPEV
jgi:hypothetical protein